MGRQVQAEGTAPASWGKSVMLGTQLGVGDLWLSGGKRDPHIGGRVLRVESSVCKMGAPRGFLSCSSEERGTERPWLCKKCTPRRQLGANSNRAQRSAWEASQPWGRGQLGVLAPRGSVLGQAAKEMVEGCSIALASRKRPPGNRQPK